MDILSKVNPLLPPLFSAFPLCARYRGRGCALFPCANAAGKNSALRRHRAASQSPLREAKNRRANERRGIFRPQKSGIFTPSLPRRGRKKKAQIQVQALVCQNQRPPFFDERRHAPTPLVPYAFLLLLFNFRRDITPHRRPRAYFRL